MSIEDWRRSVLLRLRDRFEERASKAGLGSGRHLAFMESAACGPNGTADQVLHGGSHIRFWTYEQPNKVWWYCQTDMALKPPQIISASPAHIMLHEVDSPWMVWSVDSSPHQHCGNTIEYRKCDNVRDVAWCTRGGVQHGSKANGRTVRI